MNLIIWTKIHSIKQLSYKRNGFVPKARQACE